MAALVRTYFSRWTEARLRFVELGWSESWRGLAA